MNRFLTILIITAFAIVSFLIVSDLRDVFKDPGQFHFGTEIGYLYSSKQVYVTYHVVQLGVHLVLIAAGLMKKKKLFWTSFIVSVILMLYPIFSVNV